MNPIELVRKYPVASVIGAIVIFGGVFLLMSGDEAVTTTVQSDNSSALASQQMQLQYAAQQSAVAGQIQLQSDAITGSIRLAEINAAARNEENMLAQTVALAQINATQQTTTYVSMLTAQTDQKAIEAQVQQSQIAATERVQTTQAYTNALVSISADQQRTQRAAIANQCSGFFDCLF